MNDSDAADPSRSPFNAIALQHAVLCAECDVISDSPHDRCLVCGSRSLVNISRMLGGNLPKVRARLLPADIQLARSSGFVRIHNIRRRTPRRAA